MSMIAKDWPVSGLSTELRKDRRTIANIINDNNIQPTRVQGKNKYYRMADVVNAMIGSNALDFNQERALLTKEQRRKMKRENDIEEGKVIPFDEIVDVLQSVVKQIVAILDALPLNLKRRVPALKAKDIEWVKREIAKARNAAAGIRVQR